MPSVRHELDIFFAQCLILVALGHEKADLVLQNATYLNVFSNTIAVLERHHTTGHIGIGYLRGYGLTRGAVATSIAHDSHNLIVAGTNNEDMACATNRVRELRGGIAIAVEGGVTYERNASNSYPRCFGCQPMELYVSLKFLNKRQEVLSWQIKFAFAYLAVSAFLSMMNVLIRSSQNQKKVWLFCNISF